MTTNLNATLEFALRTHLVAGPTPTLPSTRCVRVSTLQKLLLEIMKPTGLRLSGATAIRQLRDAGIAQPHWARRPNQSEPTIEFMLLGLHDLGDPDAAELLQAWLPRGVLAYGTAIALHNLSTQRLPHAHLVDPGQFEMPTDVARLPASNPAADTPNSASRHHDPLGTLAFTLQGVRHYVSKRTLPIAATQRIHLHALATGRVTTVAQTLVDCLRKPLPCGGPSVIYEAWETGWPLCADGAIAACIDAWGALDIDLCRVGALIERLDLAFDGLMQTRIENARERRKDGPFDALFAGLHYGSFDERWRLQVAE